MKKRIPDQPYDGPVHEYIPLTPEEEVERDAEEARSHISQCHAGRQPK